MSAVAIDDTDSPPINWRVWAVVIVLTLLLHALLLWMRPFTGMTAAPPRVEIQQIDPRKIEAIRKMWDKREKALLLDKDKNAPHEKEAPKDARYMSDRNIRVEKEQRAKQTNVLPIPGQKSQASQQDKAPPREKTQTKSHTLPRLGDLGIPLKLDSRPRPQPRQPDHSFTHDAGDQALNDKTLPEGSENLLNAQESVYYSFYARLYEAIAPIWQSNIREVPYRRKVGQGEYSTVVDVVFDREGSLIGINKIHESGIPEFDSAVDRSWRKIGRFPNPPKDLLDGSGQVHTGWTFTVEVGKGFNLDYMPPERNY